MDCNTRDNIVIVVDLSNYKSTYAEKCPFKAQITQNYGHEIWVKSLTTGKEYGVYEPQILEFLDIDEISKLINMDNYGL